jgi:hypothetical protein
VNNFGKLLRVKEAADLLAIAPSTLSRYRSEGLLTEGLHYVRYGDRCYRYLEDSLYHWANHRQNLQEHLDWLQAKQRNQRSGNSRLRDVPA